MPLAMRFCVHARRTVVSGMAIAMVILGGCASTDGRRPDSAPLATGNRYVSMGSSFAAGPGVAVSADTPPNRCARSASNYARQLAARLGLSLVDVACSGATTAHILGSWNELPPQIDAVTPGTRLVTITIGGNDVSFVRNLIALACEAGPQPPVGAPGGKCPAVNAPSETDWRALEAGLNQIAQEVRHRAPGAKLVFVKYVQMIPAGAACAAVPISRSGLAQVQVIQRRLAAVTDAVARKWAAGVIDPVETGAAHDPCANAPWATGFPTPQDPPFVPFHPNHAGMTAIADLLAESLKP
jgi:lysophospholipase L1-like esterase